MKTRRFLAAVAALLLASALQAGTPKWVKQFRSSVFEVIAFDEDGQEKGRSHGFFIGNDGTGICDRSVIAGAAKAVTVDAAGITRPIETVTGADDMYDIVRFTVTPDKKLRFMPLANVQTLEGGRVSILPYDAKGKSLPVGVVVKNCRKITGDRFYYTLDIPWQESFTGCPVVDEDGMAIGIVQTGSESDKAVYVLDTEFAKDIEITAFSLDSRAYSDILISKPLPSDADQALAYIFMKQSTSLTSEYGQLLEDFCKQFPDNADGLFNMGSFLILETDSTNFSRGLELIGQSIEKAAHAEKHRFHCDYANLMYNAIVEGRNPYEGWTLEKALAEIDTAIRLSDIPVYHQLRGNILYAMKRYQEAYDSFVRLNASDMASADTYMFSFTINEQMGGSSELSLALLDSAIMKCGTPMPRQAAQILLQRALYKESKDMNREAVKDLNAYENLLGSYNMNARFYLLREQVGIKAKLYGQALADIDMAIGLEQSDSSYVLEKASLLLRVGEYDRSLPILLELVGTYPDNGEIHRLTGVCYMRKEDDAKACYHLTTAKSLGDDIADSLIPQVCK